MKDSKILNKFSEQLTSGEDIYTIVKGKYCCYKVMGVDIVKNAFIGFTNKTIIVCIKEAIGENFAKVKYNEISRLDLVVKKDFFEVKITLKNGKKQYITDIKEMEEIDFLVEIANIINS